MFYTFALYRIDDLKIKLLQIGQTKQPELERLINDYKKRLQGFVNFEILSLPDIKKAKNLSKNEQKDKEAALFLKHISTADGLILLDEKGMSLTSRGFAKFYQTKMNSGLKTLCVLIGGPYGFGEKMYKRADHKISLSAMTFTHEMIRLLFVEQTYRAYAILNNLPYHHD